MTDLLVIAGILIVRRIWLEGKPGRSVKTGPFELAVEFGQLPTAGNEISYSRGAEAALASSSGTNDENNFFDLWTSLS